MERKIAVITGTRADYGIYSSVLRSINDDPELQLQLIVCGMHLCPEFGMTINEIYKDGFKISDKFETILASDTGVSMAKSIGLAIMSMAESFDRLKPDILLILGDRGEMLAGAVAASHMNIPVAHIHGGEVTGTIDESVRHAITKLSHIHFPATEDSKERIIKMGEIPENVYTVGAPGLDFINNSKFMKREEVLNRFGLKDDKIFIMTQHPVTTERDKVEWQIEETFQALVHFGIQTIVSYPNSDNGGREIIKTIEKYKNKYEFIKTYRNLSQLEYISLLNCADVMIGNSSSGIIEAASFKLPVVNIGTRQQGRLRACNVIDVDYGRNNIIDGINKALTDKTYNEKLADCVNPYGDGKSGSRIAKILKNIVIDKDLIQKRIRY